MQHPKYTYGTDSTADGFSSSGDTLWMNVHLYYDLSITQWQDMLIAVGKLVGDRVHVLLFGAGMSQGAPPHGCTAINMVELSITMPESLESKGIIATAADTIESELNVERPSMEFKSTSPDYDAAVASPSGTLWIKVSLYNNLDADQWAEMVRNVGQSVLGSANVLIFGSGMTDTTPPAGTTGVNMIEISITMAESDGSHKIIADAASAIVNVLKNNNKYDNAFKIQYGYNDKLPSTVKF